MWTQDDNGAWEAQVQYWPTPLRLGSPVRPQVAVCAVPVWSESEVAAGGGAQRFEGSDVAVDEDGEVLVSGLGGDAGERDTAAGGGGRVSGAQGVGGDAPGVQAGGVGAGAEHPGDGVPGQGVQADPGWNRRVNSGPGW